MKKQINAQRNLGHSENLHHSPFGKNAGEDDVNQRMMSLVQKMIDTAQSAIESGIAVNDNDPLEVATFANTNSKTFSTEMARQCDKFYTRTGVAAFCVEQAAHYIGDHFCIEPSAGSGSFIYALEDAGISCCGFDIAPETNHPAVKQLDYLAQPIAACLPAAAMGKPLAIIGNPPFGKRSKLALDFLNKALGEAEYVCFILPISADHWGFQRAVKADARLLLSIPLPAASFTLIGKPYRVECCFQIWSMKDVGSDLRIKGKPSVHHPDFNLVRYNTCGDPSVLDAPWDFAVLSQSQSVPAGFVLKRGEHLCRKKQWITIKAKTPTARKILTDLDYGKLSWGVSAAKGFSKGSIVHAYKEAKALYAANDNECRATAGIFLAANDNEIIPASDGREN